MLSDSGGEEEDGKMEAKASVTGPKKQRRAEAEEENASSGSKKILSQALKEHKGLFALMIKQILVNTQADRDASMILFDVFLASATALLIVKALNQNKLYSKKTQKRGHGLGSPHLYTAAGLLNRLMDMIQENMKPDLKVFTDLWPKLSDEEKTDLIKFCRIVKTYEGARKKLIISFGPSPQAQKLRCVFMSSLNSLEDVTHKMGRPPAGYMERELSQWLEVLVGKK